MLPTFKKKKKKKKENPKLRTAHFIKPTLPPFALVPPRPKIQSLSLSTKPRVHFLAGLPPKKSWLTWFEKLQPTHEPVWRKAGIFDAIKASTCNIVKHWDLLLSLGEKWCPETNTFVFPWGEATVTLEDVMVLGGFSPLGGSVLSNCSLGQNVDDLVDRMMKCRSELVRKYNSDVSQATWVEYFMGRGDEVEPELEHAAFLTLWLSRHVFTTQSRGTIRSPVFSLAARLSSGIRIALAPAVLGILYRGLRLLKEKLVHCSDCENDFDTLKLVEPLHLVQLWAWERFPMLAPIPKMINSGEPRLARWKCLSKCHISSMALKMALDSARETFRWRPYATFVENWSLPCFYDDVGKWVCVETDHEGELFACCLRGCRLESFDDLEDYHPHRVAMQFGFDQDIPRITPRSNDSLELNCGHSNGLNTFPKLYLPPRLFQGGFTVKYSDWWKGMKVSRESAPLRVYSRRKRISSNVERPLRVENLHGNLAVAVEPSCSPVECNMVENGNLDDKVKQKPVDIPQHSRQRNGNTCGDLSTALASEMINQVPIGFKSSMIPLKGNTENISTRKDQDIVVINDDDIDDDGEEGKSAPLFEKLASDMEDKIRKLEREVARLSLLAAAKSHQPVPMDTA